MTFYPPPAESPTIDPLDRPKPVLVLGLSQGRQLRSVWKRTNAPGVNSLRVARPPHRRPGDVRLRRFARGRAYANPGATLNGCGPTAAGCAGRITVSLDLLSPAGGPVIGLVFFLHGANLRACLIGRAGAFELAPGATRGIDVVLDQANECGTPVDMRTAAASVEGPDGIAARQEWGVLYTLAG